MGDVIAGIKKEYEYRRSSQNSRGDVNFFFLFGLEVHSREVSIFFQHLKPLSFYLVLGFSQVLALARGQELTKTGHKQVLLNLFSLLVDTAELPLQSQSLDEPHRIKCKYSDPSTAVNPDFFVVSFVRFVLQ